LNINPVPLGSMLASANGGADPNSLNSANFRPIAGYGDLYVVTHNGYSNYNGLQAGWARPHGRYTHKPDYTPNKALGIVTCANSNMCDQFDVSKNYGVLPNSRKHLFNAVYSVNLPEAKVNKWAGGIVNGWQVTGILQVQSEPNLTALGNQNFGMSI